MVVKTKKKKKSKGQRGNTTYGHGARKKWMKSGGRGGCGMAGTGKRADHKKSLIIKLYGNKYFGKQGITSRGTAKKKYNKVNLGDIQRNLNTFLKKFGKNNELNLDDYCILGDGELKKPLTIIAKHFTESAKEKIENLGGKAILSKLAKVHKNKIAKEDKKEKSSEKS